MANLRGAQSGIYGDELAIAWQGSRRPEATGYQAV